MAGLGRKIFTAGDVLTASDVQSYLQDQAVMVFAGTAARSSAIATPSEGMVAITTDTDELQYYNGSSWVAGVPFDAWQTWAPTLSGGWTNGTTGVWTAKYVQIGKTVIATGYFVAGNGLKGTNLNVSLPVTAANANNINGSAYCSVSLGSTIKPLMVYIGSTTTFSLLALGSAATYVDANQVTASAPLTWATGSIISFTLTYEAA
jgi:hypothetical protein